MSARRSSSSSKRKRGLGDEKLIDLVSPLRSRVDEEQIPSAKESIIAIPDDNNSNSNSEVLIVPDSPVFDFSSPVKQIPPSQFSSDSASHTASSAAVSAAAAVENSNSTDKAKQKKIPVFTTISDHPAPLASIFNSAARRSLAANKSQTALAAAAADKSKSAARTISSAAAFSDSVGSRYSACPICSKEIPISLINFHLDFECGSSASAEKKKIVKTENSGKKEKENKPMEIQPEIEPARVGGETKETPLEIPAATKDSIDPLKPVFSLFTAGPQPGSSFLPVPRSRSRLDSLPVSLACSLSLTLNSSAEPISPSQLWRHFSVELNWNSPKTSIPPLLVQKFRLSGSATTVEISLLIESPEIFDRVYEQTEISSLPDSNFNFSPSLLKSLIQKNIRLSRSDAAVRSAIALMKVSGQLELIRRLAVINIEDSILHPHYSLLIILLLVHSKKNPPVESKLFSSSADRIPLWELEFIISFVHAIAGSKVKDFIKQIGINQNNENESDENNGVELDDEAAAAAASDENSLSTDIEFDWPNLVSHSGYSGALVASLLIRANFGGMKFDCSLLRSAAALWNQRFQNKKSNSEKSKDWNYFLDSCFDAKENKFNVNNLPALALTPGDLLLSAVDQHCSPILNELLSNEIVQQSIQLHCPGSEPQSILGLTIWLHRSSLNNKSILTANNSNSQNVTANSSAAADSASHHSTAALFSAIRVIIDGFAKKFIARKAK